MADPKHPRLLSGVGLNEMIQETLSRMAVPSNIDIHRNLSEGLPPVDCDPDQMEQVFGNLLRNAVQAMREGGRLKVWSSIRDDEWVEIRISDTGEGIIPENLANIFEPLFTTRAKGIGLGLALCKTYVEGHGGTIAVESESGKGSTFTVGLPIQRTHHAEKE